MALNETLINIINTKGWLGIDSIYFDNAYTFNTETSNGYVAISASENILITSDKADGLRSQMIANSIVSPLDYGKGHISNILIMSLDSLQRFNVPLYLYEGAVTNGQPYPYPNLIPTLPANSTDAAISTYLDSLRDGMLVLNGNKYTKEEANQAVIDELDKYKDFDKDNIKYITNRTVKTGASVFKDEDTNPKTGIIKNGYASYWDLEYLKRVWFPNRREFVKAMSSYLNLSDLI